MIDVRTVNDHFPGVGRYAYQLACALARQKDRGELMLLSNARPSGTRFDLGPLASEPGVRIITTTARPFTAREQLRLPGEIRALDAAVVHFPYVVMPYAAPRPFVLNIYDIIPVRLPQFFSLRQRFLYRAALLIALRTAAAVICISEATRSDLEDAFRLDPSRLWVVPAGVAESFRACSRVELERFLNAYGLDQKYLLYVGSNKPHKNLPALIEAYAQLRAAPALVIAGAEYKRYAQERRQVERFGLKDRVRFLGAVNEEELATLYSGAHAFVFPSLYEGFGLPPLEAMACGVPVACSAIPSLREATGNAAIYFDPKDHKSIASALEQIIANQTLRADLRDRGMRRAAEMSWASAAQQTLQVYRSAWGRTDASYYDAG